VLGRARRVEGAKARSGGTADGRDRTLARGSSRSPLSACRGIPAGERPLGATPSGRPCAVMPWSRKPVARWAAGGQTESLILAQNERWRRA
jgi:hypothetical protein